jgi:hypothetical protein
MQVLFGTRLVLLFWLLQIIFCSVAAEESPVGLPKAGLPIRLVVAASAAIVDIKRRIGLPLES